MNRFEKFGKAQLLAEIVRLREDPAHRSCSDEAGLLRELQLHQAELEMQNRELKEAQHLVEEARDRYADLYDLAPVGYLTLDAGGCIREINRAGKAMLGLERNFSVGKPFIACLASEQRQPFLSYLGQVLRERGNVVAELRIKSPATAPRFVRLDSVAVAGAGGGEQACRTVMTEVTQRVAAEQQTRDLLRQNRELTGRLFGLQEEERRRLARELHDELGQWLTAIQAEAEAIVALPPGETQAEAHADIRAGAQAISRSAAEVHGVIRRMLHHLRPALLDELGLADSLRELLAQWRARRPDIAWELELEAECGGWGEALNITVYRIVQEALTNVANHSQARRATVSLHQAPAAAILLSVADDGRGMQAGQPARGLGLPGMRERVLAAGGDFSLHSAPGQGMRIEVRLPGG